MILIHLLIIFHYTLLDIIIITAIDITIIIVTTIPIDNFIKILSIIVLLIYRYY